MRLLSGLAYEDIDEYIRYLPEIAVLDTVRDKKSLLDAAGSGKYDLVLISKELPGSEEMGQIIEILASEEFKSQRLVYLYGEYDVLCDGFIRFLINHGVYDFYVGGEITSRDIESLVFRPAGREKAFGYCSSCFDNEQYFNHRERILRPKSRFFNGFSFTNLSFKAFPDTKKDKRLPFEKLIISIISNQATGKSHTAWNLGCCLSRRSYTTSLFNIDRGYSANLFFNIDEIYNDLLDFTIQNNKHRDIFDNCCKRKNLSIVTGKLGDEKEIGSDDFLKLLYGIRIKSDITIVDTRTGLSHSTRLSVKNSTYDMLIFDCDIMHFHMNMKMLEELKDDFAPEKTIAVINNTNIKSPGHKFIYNEIVNTGIPFKGIASVSSCGLQSSELMHTGLSPYQAAEEVNKSFVRDVNSLVDMLSARPGWNGSAAGIFG
ncbi:MAG TPA: hypothetical protein VEG39_10360 [Clostridia bacterium]|nr:hypothetical protein [Clostridia bacterium]